MASTQFKQKIDLFLILQNEGVIRFIMEGSVD